MTTYHARLVYDSSRAGALVGLRGYSSYNRTLLFECDVMGVDVVVFPAGAGGSYVVHGQVRRRPDDEPYGSVTVRFGGSEEQARTDKHGQFSTHWSHPEAQRVMSIVGAEDVMVCAMPDVVGEQEA